MMDLLVVGLSIKEITYLLVNMFIWIIQQLISQLKVCWIVRKFG